MRARGCGWFAGGAGYGLRRPNQEYGEPIARDGAMMAHRASDRAAEFDHCSDQVMRLGLLLVFAAIPFLEIALLIKVGQAIGFWLTLMLVVVSASLGSYVLYEQGFQTMARAFDAMSRGKAPLAPVVDGLFLALAGVLLIVPGFITDAMGLALLVPALRHRFAIFSLRKLLKSAEMRGFVFGDKARRDSGHANGTAHDRGEGRYGARRPPPGAAHTAAAEGPIIEGEFERIDERTVDPHKRGGQTPPGRD